MTKVYQHDNYGVAMQYIIDIVRNRQVDLSSTHLLIVPDKYTLECEQRVFEGTNGSINCEVMTLSRIAKGSNTKLLSKTAAVMLLKKLIMQIDAKGGFRAFGMSVGFAGFALKMYQCISQFKRCLIVPQDLLCLGDLKLNDIATVYQSYVDYCNTYRLIDSGDKLTDLTQQVLSGLLKDTHIYIANYDEFDASTRKLIAAMQGNCKSLVLSLIDSVEVDFLGVEIEVIQSPKDAKTLQCYIADHEMDEIEHIARQIVKYKKEGVNFDKMGLVFAGDKSLLMQILTRYKVPFNIDLTRDLDSFAISMCIKYLCMLYYNKYNKDTMISISKNYFCDLSNDQRVAFVQYVNKYAIDYKGFVVEWQDQLAESARVVVVQFVQDFFAILDSKTNEDLLRGLEAWIQAREDKSVQLGQVVQQDLVRVLNALLNVIADMRMLLDGENVGICIKLLVESLTVPIGILPYRKDAVMCGTPDVFRGTSKQVVFVANLNEGMLPSVMIDNGIIGDNQVKALQNIDVQLHPLTIDVNRRARLELDNIISCNGTTIHLSCVQSDTLKPAYYIRRLKHKYKTIETNLKYQLNQLNDTLDIGMLQLYLCNQDCTSKMLLQGDITDIHLRNACYHACDGSSTLHKHMQGHDQTLLNNASKLMLSSNKTSISRIEQFMTCPYKHFLRYGLNLREIEVGGTRPADIGSFLHTVLEEFVKLGCDVSKIDSIIRASLEIHYKLLLDTNIVIRQRAEFEAKHLSNIIVRQLQDSSFRPIGTEVEFGSNCQYRGIDYDGIELHGKIDRVDAYNGCIRLIDYKSGKSQFSHKELYLGKKIQLLMYMQVFLQLGYRPAGSFYFPAIAKWDDDEYSYQLKGIYNSDIAVIYALDNNLSQCMPEHDKSNPLKSMHINCQAVWDTKTNEPKLKPQINKGIHEDTIAAMASYASNIVAKTLDNIKDGFVERRPLVVGKSSCQYCEYKRVCVANGKIRSREFVTTVSKAELYCYGLQEV
ncbi:MAG: PD-(D/E)XK nuclease family protein [Clostridiales bacterium]|jgi:ATP-dependent helicase/nuclease subunit B|nr:PD-(D/E)XK nuclease family protein [Clostridiales bacterium]